MVNFLLCFSVIKNTKAVLNTDVPKGSITAINGMRTLSITWVVLGHALAFALQFIGRFEIREIPAKEMVFKIFCWKSFQLEACLVKSLFCEILQISSLIEIKKQKKKIPLQVFHRVPVKG